MITILYFAGLKERTGVEKEHLNFSNRTVKELLEHIQQKYDSFSNVVHVAINEEYVTPDDIIQENDVVAFIPPVSGG